MHIYADCLRLCYRLPIDRGSGSYIRNRSSLGAKSKLSPLIARSFHIDIPTKPLDFIEEKG